GVSVAPTFKRYFVILPCNGFVAGFETVADHVWEVKQNLHKKLPPDKLRKPGFAMLHCKGHTPTYGNGAEPQGGRYLCCVAVCWKISVLMVVFNDCNIQFRLLKCHVSFLETDRCEGMDCRCF